MSADLYFFHHGVINDLHAPRHGVSMQYWARHHPETLAVSQQSS
ncbi:hypothetical protein JOF35_005167 [Streptomyces demainii]|uniref:Uncharacterized protein n=1 Tax=Streptomyces demainii TaxID=588122 RepID=A0ABT9KXN4_9ACTN|nr:hypothetical protein [Streptomyces demainii]